MFDFLTRDLPKLPIVAGLRITMEIKKTQPGQCNPDRRNNKQWLRTSKWRDFVALLIFSATLCDLKETEIAGNFVIRPVECWPTQHSISRDHQKSKNVACIERDHLQLIDSGNGVDNLWSWGHSSSSRWWWADECNVRRMDGGANHACHNDDH